MRQRVMLSQYIKSSIKWNSILSTDEGGSMTLKILPVIIGYIMDLILGDPVFLYHPVRALGVFIEKGEKILRQTMKNTDKSLYYAGMILSIALILCTGLFYSTLVFLAGKINIYLKVLLEAYLVYRILAVKSLKKESMKVYTALKEGDIESARLYLSYIVGRDTQNLNSSELSKGAVETVAENTSDGVLAPLFYIFLGGPVLGFMYKAINTLDSMIGYKNDKYLYFGRFAAKLDDIANYIPARLSAAVLLLTGLITGLDFKQGYAVFKRDRYNHLSPNSAQTEAVCAGLLNIRLGGPNYYFGKIVDKPYIGDEIKKVEPEDIVRVNRLMVASSAMAILVFSLIRYFIS